MHYLYAQTHQLDAVQTTLRERGLDDVKVHRPFLGKAVIWCGSVQSRDELLETVDLQAASAA